MQNKQKGIILIFFSLIISNTSAQDWANFKQFKDANSMLPLLRKGDSRIVFMGNSITIGWEETHPEFFKNKPYINRGISGQTTPQMLVRFRADVIDIGASTVVILAGTNDIAGNTGPVTLDMILNNLKSMTEIALANNVKVILCSVLPAYDYPWSPKKDPNIKIPKLNSKIEKYAKKSGVYFLDYFKVLDNGNNGINKKYSYDGVHLTLEGYKLLEPLVEKAIKKVSK
mgnify:CR=1 FL=1